MPLNRVFERGQSWLIKPMKKLNYLSNEKGICHGIGYMGVQAILAEELDVFDSRLIKIYYLPTEQLLNQIDLANKEKVAIIEKVKKEMEKISHSDAQTRQSKIEEYTANNKKIIYSEIPNFFDGVELYQQCYKYPELFPFDSKPIKQDVDYVFSMLENKKIQDQGGIKELTTFTGAYDKNDLIAYFTSLRSTLESSGSDQPISIVFSNVNHAISIGYSPKTKMWSFINANELPTQYFKDEAELSSRVISAMSKNDFAVLKSKIYCTQKNSAMYGQCIDQWKQQDTWNSLHHPNYITPERATRVDSNNLSWLHLAVNDGEVDLAKKLFVAGADPSLHCTAWKNGKTPIILAFLKKLENLASYLSGERPKNPKTFKRKAENDPTFPTESSIFKLPTLKRRMIATRPNRSPINADPEHELNIPLTKINH